MLKKCNLLALALGFALSMNSCHLLQHQDDEDPKPQTKGWVKGTLKYMPSMIPAVVCDPPCDWTEPLQTKMYFTKKQSYYSNNLSPEIVDSTESNANGEFEKQLPEGSYSLFVTYEGQKYESPIWTQPTYGKLCAYSFEVTKGETTLIKPIVSSRFTYKNSNATINSHNRATTH